MSAAPVASPLRNAARSLQVPAFRAWFASQVLSASGTTTQSVAQSWIVLSITGHPINLGVLAAVSWAPVLLCSAWAGAVSDRVDRRRLLFITQTLFIVICAVQAVLLAENRLTLWMIYTCAAAGGLVTAFDNPTRGAYVFELVGREQIASAIGLNEIVLNTSRVLGPALGGLLLANVGATWCFVFNAASFVPVLFVLLAYPTQRAVVARRDATAKRADGGVREGVAFAFRTPGVRSCIFIAMAGGMLFGLGVTVPILTTKAFHLGPGGFGAMMACFGLGALPGAIAAASAAERPTGMRVHTLTALTGCAVVLTAFSPTPIGAFIGIALAGFLSIWLISLATAMVQLMAGAQMQGRIMGIWTMAMPGLSPFTAMLISWIGQVAGGRWAFSLSGLALLLVAVVTFPVLRRVEAPAEVLAA